MKQESNVQTMGAFIVASAIVWGVVLVACAMTLRGTEFKEEISSIITGGLITHMVLNWMPLMKMIIAKKRAEQQD